MPTLVCAVCSSLSSLALFWLATAETLGEHPLSSVAATASAKKTAPAICRYRAADERGARPTGSPILTTSSIPTFPMFGDGHSATLRRASRATSMRLDEHAPH